MPQIEVSFDVDANGILDVTAKDKASGKVQSIKIEASSGLSEDDIKKMQDDAESHEEEDKKKKELIDAKNTAEQVAYTAEKALSDAGDKVPAETKTAIEEKVKALREAKDKDGATLEDIKTATDSLSAEMQKIYEILQKQQAESSQEGEEKPEGEETSKEGNVRDAEVEDDDTPSDADTSSDTKSEDTKDATDDSKDGAQ
jgi:molecular chaperone DnaK